ncbi:MAG: DUF2953 domain-containing protein, partial [Oscillospiraceae bacterium]
MILAWICIIILAVLVLFLALPICLKVKMDYDKFTVKLRILFLSFNLYPTKKEKVEQEQEQDQSQNVQNKKKKNKKLTLDKIIGIISTAGGAIKIVLKGLFIKHIEIVLPIHEENPADTGIAYGKAQAYLGSTVATLEHFLHLSFKKINIIPDFTGEFKYTRYFYCNIWGTPFIIVIAAIYAFKRIYNEKLL